MNSTMNGTMNRMRWLSGRGLMVLALSLLAAAAQALPERFTAGVNYRVLAAPGPVDKPGKIEVREFFWYGCPHCFRLEPLAEKWQAKLPADVNFVRTPGTLAEHWLPHARAYYVARQLGVADKAHRALFEAIHQKRLTLDAPETLAAFYAAYGVDKKRFMAMMERDMSVDRSVRQATQLAVNYQLTGVPVFVINGKYATDVSMAKGEAQVFDVINYLVAKERAAAGKK